LKSFKLELITAAVFALIFVVALAFWGDWLGGKLSKAEVDEYIVKIEKNLEWPGKDYMLESIREWGYADDGKEFMMLNMMRYRDEILQYPGTIKDFKGTPKESNRTYELGTKEIIITQGGYPSVWGEVNLEGRNIFRADDSAANVDWDRLGFARYPNRRSFMKLMATPEYGVQSAYKQMGAQVNMIPITPEWVIPDPRLIVGLLLLSLFFAIAWIHALIRCRN
jgi:hypothetical protein